VADHIRQEASGSVDEADAPDNIEMKPQKKGTSCIRVQMFRVQCCGQKR
jgi:hypothetical protein